MSLSFIRYFSVNISKYFEIVRECVCAFYTEYENVNKFFVFAILFEKLKRVLF